MSKTIDECIAEGEKCIDKSHDVRDADAGILQAVRAVYWELRALRATIEASIAEGP